MNTEMKSIEDVKVADVFDLTRVAFPSTYTDKQVKVAGRAIANYDRLTGENKRLRESLQQLVTSAAVNEEQLNDLLLCSDYGESEALCKARQLLEELPTHELPTEQS